MRRNPDGGGPVPVMTREDRRDAQAVHTRGKGSAKRRGDWDYDDVQREIERLERRIAHGK